jgi:two-component system alkaline phosphatase synthesis response regulator PhoP
MSINAKPIHVLIVEDEADISELISFNLTADGFHVDALFSGDSVVEFATRHQPEIILLDVMIPGKDGFQVCRELKSEPKTSHIPVVFLTAKSLEHNVIAGLEIGADDYISKPFSIPILISKMKAILRRSEDKRVTPDAITAGGVSLDTTTMRVQVDGETILLNATEFHILRALMNQPGWVLTRQNLMDACQSYDQLSTARSVDVLMVSIRKKLGAYATCIETVRGVGYRFKTIDA